MSAEEIHDHDRGLSHDLPKIVEQGLARRRLFGLLGGVSAAAVVAACGSDDSSASSTSSSSASTSTGSSGSAATGPGDVSAGEIPEETGGPYPGDGSNGQNVLTQSGVVRSDIRSSFGGATGVAEGVPLTVRLKVYDLNGSEAKALSGAAVYIWHCDRDGNYSLYSQAAASENYLRGVQAAGDDGVVTFDSIFPAAYQGRWPHIHFEVYPSLDTATDEANKIATSQIALPKDACDAVYSTGGYEQSVRNMQSLRLETDMVFADDGGVRQLGTMTGDVAGGYGVRLTVPVSG